MPVLRLGVPCGTGRGLAKLLAQLADFAVRARKETGDLGLQGACIDDLAKRGIGGQGKR